MNQVMGDGIMALFGAPLTHEDHAVRACYAALRMQESLRRYAEDTRRGHGVEVQIRVGINSGQVVVGSVGNDLRMDYTAVGQTTHLAARMEQLAPPGTIRLTGETVRLAEGYVEVKSLGPAPVKGLAEPIEIFDDAIAAGEDSLRTAQAVDQPFTLMHGYFGVGIPHLVRGDLARAIPPLERGFALCRATEQHLWLGEIAADFGLAYARAGRADDAIPVLEAALEEAATTGLRFAYSRQHAQVGAAYLLIGQTDEAGRVAAIALDAARAQKQRGQEAAALWLSAKIAGRALDAQRAEAHHQ